MVWVIGESDTRWNWSLYGYQRETNPEMKKLANELLIFKNIYAAAPSTVPASKRMFTSATITQPELWQKDPNILLMSKQAGYHIYWISNHSTASKGIISIFAHHCDEIILTNNGRSRSEGSFDEVILKPYSKALEDNYDKKLIVVHLLGSHLAYDFRYPKS